MDARTFSKSGSHVFYPADSWIPVPVVHDSHEAINAMYRVTETTAWLLNVPGLEHQSRGHDRIPIITPASAERLYNNCRFHRCGLLQAISPALVRRSALCWIAPITNTQHVYRSHAGPPHDQWEATKCAYRLGRDRIRPKLIQAAGWSCRSVAHSRTTTGDVSIDTVASNYVKYDICGACVQYIYVDTPVNWYTQEKLRSLKHPQCYETVWFPVWNRYELKHVLRGFL